MRIIELGSGEWQSGQVLVAESFWQRLRGLIARPPDTAILIPGRSVHGIGMTRPCRVVALDRRYRVLAVRVLRPGRVVSVPGTSRILELPESIPPPPLAATLGVTLNVER